MTIEMEWWQWLILAVGSLAWVATAARLVTRAVLRALDERKER